MANIQWISGVDGAFNDAADWSTGTVPGPADNAQIQASGTYTVTSSLSESVRSLALGANATLSLTGGTLALSIGEGAADELTVGATANIAIGAGATLSLITTRANLAQVSLTGTIEIASGGILDSDAFYMGAGAIDMSGPDSKVSGEIDGNVNISGQGLITGTGPGIGALNSDGIVNANVSGGVLEITFADNNNTTLFAGVSTGKIMEATDGSTLLFKSLTNATMTVEGGSLGTLQAVGAGSQIDLNNVDLVGAKLATSGGGVIETLAGGATLGGFSHNAGGVMEGVQNAGSVLVNDGTTLGVASTLTNTGTISLASTGDATSIRIESIVDFTDTQKDTAQSRVVTLTGDGAVTLSDDSNNLIYATHATDTLDNEDNTISGAGQIGGGSTMGLTNRGVIDATGENALVIDVATGKVTNGVHGVIEGSGPAGLVVSGGTLNNTGTVAALNGSAVLFDGSASIANDVAGALTGGVWKVTDSGGSASLTLNGAAITTLAATVVLTGDDSFFETGGQSLEASLATIAAKGKLEQLAGRDWNGSNALTDAGLLQLGGGTFVASGLTVAAAGTVSGLGAIDAPVANDGVVQAYRGILDLTGAVTGSGTLKIWGGSTLTLGADVAASQGVLFATGIHATLKLGEPSAFASTITNWALGDTIDLAATDATSATISGDTLSIDLQGGGALDYSLANPPTGARIVLSSDGSGGTNLTLYKAPSPAPAVALLSQSMAAMAVSAGAGTAVPAAPSDTRLAMITTPSHA